jgi:aryl-alcohol dehydrogenase-like predicted oxidoreductase
MNYRHIGQTGISVSEIGFGCGNNAVLMVKASYEEQVKAVRHALDLGINYFDTAFAYGLGKSEENLGRILNELKPRAIVSTKIRLEAGALSDIKSAAIKAIEDALQRLQRERVDFIQLHTRVTRQRGMGKRFSLTPEDVLGSNGVVDGFKAMQRRNKVGFFGFSGLGDPEALHQLVDSGQFQAFQVYYNLLNPSAGYGVPPGFNALDYRLILDRAAAKGMGSFVIRVLAAGALTAEPDAGGGSSPEPLSPGSDYPLDLERAEKIKRVLGIQVKELPQAAIRFALMNPKISTVLVGFSNTRHIDEAVACSGAPPLSDTQMSEVKKLWQTDFDGTKKP